MTGMDQAIERAARAIWDAQAEGLVKPRDLAEVLASAGLLAPAPLTEEWSAAFTGIAPDGTEHIRLIGTPGGREHAQETCDDCNADDPDVLFFLVRRPVYDWLPVDRAEGDGRADQ